MHQTRHRHVRIFAARIGHVVGRRPGFFDPRNDLTPDRIIRIVARDQVEKVRRDREGELVAGEQNAAAFLVAKIDMLLELGERCDPVFELPFPIVPEFRRHIWPISRRMRDELFPVQFPYRSSKHFKLRTKNVNAINYRVNGDLTCENAANALFNGDERADRDLGKEFARGFGRQTDAAVRGRIIRDHAFVHSEIEAAQAHEVWHVDFINSGAMAALLVRDDVVARARGEYPLRRSSK